MSWKVKFRRVNSWNPLKRWVFTKSAMMFHLSFHKNWMRNTILEENWVILNWVNISDFLVYNTFEYMLYCNCNFLLPKKNSKTSGKCIERKTMRWVKLNWCNINFIYSLFSFVYLEEYLIRDYIHVISIWKCESLTFWYFHPNLHSNFMVFFLQ